MVDQHALKAAAFLIQALDLEGTPAELAGEITSLKRETNTGVSTVELESSAGPAAFLVYDYQLAVADERGETGQARFDADVATLERATVQDTPGPRIVAHGTTDGEGFILATTPAVFRALTGQAPTTLEATEADLLPGAETAKVRTEAAGELIRVLREADEQAKRWLRAIQAESAVGGDPNDLLEFTEAEAALALYLIDEQSTHHLFKAMKVFVESARNQADQALGGSAN